LLPNDLTMLLFLLISYPPLADAAY